MALYARVSSAAQKEDALRQMQRLRDYAAAKGYQVMVEVTEIASGVNDNRPKLNKLLRGPKIGTELDLNNKQRTACLRHAGAARFACNFGLRRKAEAYQAGDKVPSATPAYAGACTAS